MDYDEIIDNLKEGDLRFEKPKQFHFRRAEPIKLTISVDNTETQATQQDDADVTEEKVRITRLMRAELNGSDFEVTPSGPQTRVISRTLPAEWIWHVKPLSYGEAKPLTVYVHGLLFLEDEETSPILIHSFTERFTVDITILDWTIVQLGKVEPVYTVIAGIVAGVSGIATGAWAFLRRRRQASPDDY